MGVHMAEAAEAMERPVLKPGEEWVWDYPQPALIEDSQRHVRVMFNDVVIADTRRAKRVCEKGQPPVFYIPPGDVQMQYLQGSDLSTT
jgi:uncharacterized protein (DUF427 family)